MNNRKKKRRGFYLGEYISGFRESKSFSEDYDNNLNLNLKYIEGKVLEYDEEDFSKNDENDFLKENI